MTDAIDQRLDRIAETARRLKLNAVREHGDDQDESLCDIQPVIIVMRNDDLIAQVLPEPGPMGPREAAYGAALLLRPHEIYLVADSYMKEAANEEYVESIEPSQINEEWSSGQREGITECIAITRIPLVGQPRFRHYPYKRTGRNVKWLPPVGGAESAGGAVIEYAQDGFAQGKEKWPEVLADLESAVMTPSNPAKDDEPLMVDTYHRMYAAGYASPDREHLIDRACAIRLSQQGPIVTLMKDDSYWVNGEES